MGFLVLPFSGQMDTSQAKARVGGPCMYCPSLLFPSSENWIQEASFGLVPIISWAIEHKDWSGLCRKGLSAWVRASQQPRCSIAAAFGDRVARGLGCLQAGGIQELKT